MKQKKNHLCVDKDDIFHERVMENPLKNSNFKMHGTKNKGIFINAETYQNFEEQNLRVHHSVGKNIYIDKLDYIKL